MSHPSLTRSALEALVLLDEMAPIGDPKPLCDVFTWNEARTARRAAPSLVAWGLIRAWKGSVAREVVVAGVPYQKQLPCVIVECTELGHALVNGRQVEAIEPDQTESAAAK